MCSSRRRASYVLGIPGLVQPSGLVLSGCNLTLGPNAAGPALDLRQVHTRFLDIFEYLEILLSLVLKKMKHNEVAERSGLKIMT